jgi:hypothetical protein
MFNNETQKFSAFFGQFTASVVIHGAENMAYSVIQILKVLLPWLISISNGRDIVPINNFEERR